MSFLEEDNCHVRKFEVIMDPEDMLEEIKKLSTIYENDSKDTSQFQFSVKTTVFFDMLNNKLVFTFQSC